MKVCAALLLLVLVGCSEQAEKQHQFELPPVSESLQLPDSIRIFSEHAKQQAILGRALFYDERLSRNNTHSCASCHKIEHAFADNLPLSVGANAGLARRNTPTLFNLILHSSFFWDGGIPRLVEVSLAPMENHHELDLPINELAMRLREIPTYSKDFKRIYDREPDPYSITRALFWFQASLISSNSLYDQYLNKQIPDLPVAVAAGASIFFNPKNGCVVCHVGPNFSDQQFHNIGLIQQFALDTGRTRISMNWEDFGKFKTPSLRNLGFSAPYMHDGRFKTLIEVLQYFNRGGDEADGQSPIIKPLGLSEEELHQLEAFLMALNDSIFVNHHAFKPIN